MNKNTSTVSKVLRYIGKYKLLMLVSAVLALGIVALTLYVPILIGKSIDLIIGKGLVDVSGILEHLTAAGILILITALMQWIMSTIKQDN
ncbi:MAG: ABC transporter ATP-binding protein, partial [Ruminococcaceae bacterium]|nr:ABC transporter ATP-binding protein [Oscillospiraceae bacterium]